jgi:hypothetical protein
MERVTTLLEQAQAAGLKVRADRGRLVVRGPQSAEALARQLLAHKGDLMRLLSAPPADVIANEPCDVCGSRERWLWLDGRSRCRVCLVLDLAPMTLGPVSEREKNSCSH